MEKLTDRRIAGLKGTGARQEIKDEQSPLVLVVNSAGTDKVFQVRWKKDGKSRRHLLGSYPDLKLADAREQASAFKAAVRKGMSPQSSREGGTADQVGAITVSVAFAAYMAQEGDKKVRSQDRWRAFALDIEPTVGAKALADLTFADWEELVLRKYQRLVKAGHRGTGANRLQALLSAFLNWSASPKGRVCTGLTTNPFRGMSKVVDEIARERWLNRYELKLFFRSLPEAGEFAAPFELLLRTMARRSEILGLTKNMVRSDLGGFGEYLRLPNTKNGKPFIIPLHPSARALLPSGLGNVESREGVWSSPRGGYLSMDACSNPVGRVRRAMQKAAAADDLQLEDWSLHDLRRTGTTMLGMFYKDRQAQVSPFIKDRLLNHVDPSVRGRHYDQYAYFFDKEHALTLFNDELDRIKAEALAELPIKLAA